MLNDGCPMQMEHALLREAARVASKQTVRRVHLLAEMMKLESRPHQGEPKLEDLRREAENCGRAAERLISYDPIGGEGMECPRCWILNGEHVPLWSDKGGNNLRCDKCEWRDGRLSTIAIMAPRTSEARTFRTKTKTFAGDYAPLTPSASHAVTALEASMTTDRFSGNASGPQPS